MTALLQLTDCHLAAQGRSVSGLLDTERSLRDLVDRLCVIRHQLGPLDALLVSGDISDDGSVDSYNRFLEIVAPLQLPVWAVPGNHDHRENMRSVLGEVCELPSTGRLNWRRRVGAIDLIGLDTLIEGEGGGILDSQSLAFLKSQLDAAEGRPVLIAMHHPPFNCGIEFMERIGLHGIDALADLLSTYRNDIRLVCGHIHNTMIATVGGKVALSAPASCSTFAFDLRADAAVGFFALEDGLLYHRWQGDFQSVRIGAETGTGPHPF